MSHRVSILSVGDVWFYLSPKQTHTTPIWVEDTNRNKSPLFPARGCEMTAQILFILSVVTYFY